MNLIAKRITLLILLLNAMPLHSAVKWKTESVDGLVWVYNLCDWNSSVGAYQGAEIGYSSQGSICCAVPEDASGEIKIPHEFCGCPVIRIVANAFHCHDNLTSVLIPSSVEYIGNYAFEGCSSLERLIFEGNAPLLDVGIYSGQHFFENVSATCTAYVMPSSKGWGVTIPGTWNGIKIAYLKSVDFNANGGTVSAPTRWLADGSDVGPLPTPSRTGYTFSGWFTATSGGSQLSASTTVSANVTYYAHWTANKYTITFNANGGEGGTSTSLSYDTTLGTLPEATRYDFDFGGWWTAANGGLEISSSTKVTGDATYFAHWIDPIPELTGVVTDDMVSETLAGSADSKITSKITTPSLYTEYRQWINSKELSHKAAKASPNAWLSYALDAPGLMAKLEPLASDDVVIESIAPSSVADGAFDLAVSIGGAEIGEGARLAEVLGIEGAAELDESAFSSEGLTVSLGRTADGKAKATVTPDGVPPAFFLRVRVK